VNAAADSHTFLNSEGNIMSLPNNEEGNLSLLDSNHGGRRAFLSTICFLLWSALMAGVLDVRAAPQSSRQTPIEALQVPELEVGFHLLYEVNTRERDLEDGAAPARAHTAPKAYLTAMTFDDALQERETKPGATLLLRCEKGLEDLSNLVRRNPLDDVSDNEMHLTLVPAKSKPTADRKSVKSIGDQV
jgi:hypothetical protein